MPHYSYAALIALTVFSVLLMALAIIRKFVRAASYPTGTIKHRQRVLYRLKRAPKLPAIVVWVVVVWRDEYRQSRFVGDLEQGSQVRNRPVLSDALANNTQAEPLGDRKSFCGSVPRGCRSVPPGGQ